MRSPDLLPAGNELVLNSDTLRGIIVSEPQGPLKDLAVGVQEVFVTPGWLFSGVVLDMRDKISLAFTNQNRSLCLEQCEDAEYWSIKHFIKPEWVSSDRVKLSSQLPVKEINRILKGTNYVCSPPPRPEAHYNRLFLDSSCDYQDEFWTQAGVGIITITVGPIDHQVQNAKRKIQMYQKYRDGLLELKVDNPSPLFPTFNN